MQTTIDGRTVGFDIQGQGIPLLLMHAFPLNRSMFREQLDALAETARILTFDVPGMGDSDLRPASMDDIADLGVGLLDAHGIEKAVVGGVSMGGYASFALARRHGGRLAGLVLANTKPGADSDESKAGRRDLAKVAREQGSDEIATRLLPKLLSKATLRQRPDVVERVRSWIASADPEAIARLLDSLANRPDSTPLLGEIKVPTLVIAGADDTIVPATEAKAWAQQIPGADFVQIPQAGHLPNLETPDVFNSEIETFLQKRVSW